MDSCDIFGMIMIMGVSVILPITVISLFLRRKMDSEKIKKEIILAALEKNANIDIENLVRKLNTPEKLLKEKLLQKLQIGLVSVFLGVGLLAVIGCFAYTGGHYREDFNVFGFLGAVFLAVGIAFMISYFEGRKMLAKEMEAEEQNLRQVK